MGQLNRNRMSDWAQGNTDRVTGCVKSLDPYCLRCLCCSQYGVLSFKIRLLCSSRATLGPPGPQNRERVCVCQMRRVWGLWGFSMVCCVILLCVCWCVYEKESGFMRCVFVSVCDGWVVCAAFQMCVCVRWIWRCWLPHSLRQRQTGPHSV